jgi:hypothetical protein
MTATTIPTDLKDHRERGMALTGLRGDDWGISPDEDHKRGGGYHCGEKDCQDIGKYHPPAVANVGSATEDYSVRQMRDRGLGGNAASAEDIGDNWPRGGRAAWLRFNNLLVRQMRAGDPALRALRAVNFSPDGVQRKRYDSLHPEAGIIASTDTVDSHTHLEYWRNTANTPGRQMTFGRVEAIIQAAILNVPLDQPEEEDDDMGATLTGHVTPYEEDEAGFPLAYPLPTGLNGAGMADPRDGFLSFVADTFGEPYALRLMWTYGVVKNGNVAWQSLFTKEGDPNRGKTEFVIASGERWWVQLPQNCVCVTVLRRAVVDGKPVPVVLKEGEGQVLAPDVHIAWFIERGAVKKS